MFKKDLLKLYYDALSYYAKPLHWERKKIIMAVIFLFIYFSIFIADYDVRLFFASIHNDFFDFIFNIGHLYGKLYLTIFFFLLLYLSGIILGNSKLRESGWKIIEAYIIAGVLVTFLKSLFGRWGPYAEHGNFSFVFITAGPNEQLSLPSGDVAIAFAFSTIVAFFYDNKLWKIFWYGLAVLTAIGRIYHDQHWLTDVILSAFISISAGIQINKQYQFSKVKR